MFATDRTFRLLRCRRRVPVLQPDQSGVIFPLLDAVSGIPFLVSTKKLRRALAGKQRQVLCRTWSPERENAFFGRIEEFVAVDPQAGEYVILSPLVHVLGTRHGDPLIPIPQTAVDPILTPMTVSQAPAGSEVEGLR